jgi:uncharacterized protein (DUF305 family)
LLSALVVILITVVHHHMLKPFSLERVLRKIHQVFRRPSSGQRQSGAALPSRLHVSAAAALAVTAGVACASAGHGQQAPPERARPPYVTADVRFMAGMIVHHGQAVLMAGWAPSHAASGAVRTLCERIVVAQRDEIAFIQRWLRERHETVPPADPQDPHMPGMDRPMLMPGMLTAAQLAQLDGASGPEFDRLFLTFMIQHHQGAITMVEQLLHAQGAAQDGQVFRFAADVNADQTTEIDRMSSMLEAFKRSHL